jgi:DNA-binding MarR family transcriptional regulator
MRIMHHLEWKLLLFCMTELTYTMSTSESTQATDTADPTWDAVVDLPPSAKLVAKVLDYDGPLTQSQLAEETLLPARTVRYALTRLEDADVVDSRFSFNDARKRVYTLSIEE